MKIKDREIGLLEDALKSVENAYYAVGQCKSEPRLHKIFDGLNDLKNELEEEIKKRK